MSKMQISRFRAPIALLALLAALLGVTAGCAGHRPRGAGPNWREEGLASWYGADFHGRRTASGERYNMYAMTAAHKTLPLGTPVVVTNRQTGQRVRVRVNDRGPFVAGRIIDLSLAAARALGSARAGVVPVTVEATLAVAAFAASPPTERPAAPGPAARAAAAPAAAPPLRGAFAVQVGSFTVEANARSLAARLPAAPATVRVAPFEDNRGVWWRVRVTGYEDEIEAEAAAAAYAEASLSAIVVRED